MLWTAPWTSNPWPHHSMWVRLITMIRWFIWILYEQVYGMEHLKNNDVVLLVSLVHKERFVKSWFDEFVVENLQWLGQSPDLIHAQERIYKLGSHCFINVVLGDRVAHHRTNTIWRNRTRWLIVGIVGMKVKSMRMLWCLLAQDMPFRSLCHVLYCNFYLKPKQD